MASPARALAPAALLVALALAGCVASPAPIASRAPGPAFAGRIGHVFVVVLENKDYDETFGQQPKSPYLGRTLPSMGRLLTNYYGTGHHSLDNYVSMVSGQAPNVVTQEDCAAYVDFAQVTTLDGQAVGQGCVYPASVATLADQLQAAGIAWRLYAEDMANSAPRAPDACRHPPVDTLDPWQDATATDQYATRHVPFVYFHRIIDDEASCRAHVVDLRDLGPDLNDSAATPRYAFLVPDLCADGHDPACADGGPGGYDGIEAWLRQWVPRILATPAYQQDGLLVVTFDESEDDNTACCAEPTGPNTPMPGLEGPGGGRIGAVLLSPCLPAGTQDATPYNHYGLLRTLEDLYRVPRLGYAGQAGLADIDLGPCSVGGAAAGAGSPPQGALPDPLTERVRREAS